VSINLRRLTKTSDKDFFEVVRHSMWAFIVLGVAGFVQIALDLVLARSFGAQGVGIFSLAFTIIFMLSLVGRLGFNRAVIRFIPRFKIDKDWEGLKGLLHSAESITFRLSILLTFTTYISAPYLATHIFHQPELTSYIKLFSLSLTPMALLYVRTGFLSGLKAVKESVFLERASQNIITLLFIFIAGNRIGLGSAVIGMVAGTFISAVMCSFVLKRIMPPTNKHRAFDKKLLIIVAAPLLFVDFSNQMTGQINVLILGTQLPASAVGVFSATLRLSALISLILNAVNAIATTKFSELYTKKELQKLELVASKSSALSLLAGLPFILILYFAPSQVLGLFGASFRETGIDSLRILVLAHTFNLATGSTVQMLAMTGNQKELAYGTVSTILILNIILSIIFVPLFGINGAALAVALSLTAKNVVLYALVKKRLGISTLPFAAAKHILNNL
jgi:O-antigen/teichoic acid export membrane protein